MRVVIFNHSVLSDWNHGNAHFLRGIATELIARGHDVRLLEPCDAWSRRNLVQEHGEAPLEEFARAYPELARHMAPGLRGALIGPTRRPPAR